MVRRRRWPPHVAPPLLVWFCLRRSDWTTTSSPPSFDRATRRCWEAERRQRGTGLPVASSTPGQIVLVPIARQGVHHPLGILVAGTSQRLPLDDAYRDFLTLVASQIGAAIAAAQALEEAEGRAEALAELDRAKTAFFSNVSHEFRTPLTLMIGPTEDALGSPEKALRGEELETVHRNELRLLKLVNTLLDFSRIEAGRVTATFEATDLAALTADLASAFRSATERAGLQLVVDCPPLPSAVYVDREMWEKIVLNLLSNAFKFTFQGSIGVAVAATDTHVELRVRDTGIGIAPHDLDHIFDRFHRIERTAARTHEGSGIGLALVRELVAIHGGTVDAASVLGEGTVFTVRLPVGTAHLARERIAPVSGRGDARSAPLALGATPYVEEALRWLPAETSAHTDRQPEPTGTTARILVADDNADMRDYLSRLLSARFQVEVVGDGTAALEAVRRRPPDVIISDVMMPGLDGFQLLAALRADEAVRTTPFILLSARAGEEARIDGLHAGADDYLVKPFSARELIARVDAQLVRAKLRSLEEAQAVRLASVFAHAPVGIATLKGAAHVFEFANRRYLDLIGGRPVEGKPIRDALPELEGQGIYELLDGVYQSGEPFEGRSVRVMIQRQRSAPEEAFFDFVYQPLFDDAAQVTGIAIVAFDVTELTNARRDAEAANRAKDEFLAMLGHELRNPLAPILTALQLMRLRNESGAERERTIIERQVNHMVSLVDDLLDVSRITRGKVQLRRERIDLADIVAKAIEMTSPAIESRRHTLTVDVPRGSDRGRGCRASGPGDSQPADECGEVYRPWRPDRRVRLVEGLPGGTHGHRYRSRHSSGHVAAHLRPLCTRAPGNRPFGRRAWPRLGDCEESDAGAWRHRRRAQRGQEPRGTIQHPHAAGGTCSRSARDRVSGGPCSGFPRGSRASDSGRRRQRGRRTVAVRLPAGPWALR